MTFRLPITLLAASAVLLFAPGAFAQKKKAPGAPKIFNGYLKANTPVKGELVIVIPPEGIEAYVKKVEKAAAKDPEWFKEYSKNSKPGIPLPYHTKLGLSKKEYADYIKLWDAREMKPLRDGAVRIELQPAGEGQWKIGVNGKGTSISLLKYQTKTGNFKSPNGELKRLKDIDADPRSILGKWTGQEWKFLQEGTLGKEKENFAIGKLVGTKWGLLVYRMQSIGPAGTPIFDKSMVIRFPLAAK